MYCICTALVSEFEWTESVELRLLTTMEFLRQLFCRVTDSGTLYTTDQGSSLGL